MRVKNIQPCSDQCYTKPYHIQSHGISSCITHHAVRYLRYNWCHNGWYCSHRFDGKLSHVIRNNPSSSVTRYHGNVSRQSCRGRPFAILVWNASDSHLSFPRLLDLWTHLVLHKWSNKLSLLHRLHVNTVRHWFRSLASDCLSVTPSFASHFPEGETDIDVYLGTGVSCGNLSRIWMVKVTTLIKAVICQNSVSETFMRVFAENLLCNIQLIPRSFLFHGIHRKAWRPLLVFTNLDSRLCVLCLTGKGVRRLGSRLLYFHYMYL